MAAWGFLAGDCTGRDPVGNTRHLHPGVLLKGLAKLPVYPRISCHLEVRSACPMTREGAEDQLVLHFFGSCPKTL